MLVKSQEDRPICKEDDISIVRSSVKRVVALLNFSLVNQTKIITAASELARNTLEHGKGGHALIQIIDDGTGRIGLRMIFEDTGPGIPDTDRALEDGFTTGNGMGLGLGGARRLMDEFQLESHAGSGTKVSITKWQERL
ncbi:anti-sigma regulatory factor [Candidatus Obscuribacterales bacterium]|nr:anti-sigma regulatory factor [Candidatus Obscuribacterales bacterium]MBX3152592.1 anti-sigma regulatory factor [Candidatus Obscuribacterales bacterium]